MWETLAQTQPIPVRILQQGLKKNRLAHAYLFEGAKGTGKMDMALQLAKVIFCESLNGMEPCYQCAGCKRIDSGNHPDLNIVTPDGLSIKKQQIQDLQAEFAKTGVESNKKVYIIEHADKMTANAANSLLKFLEEPSSETVAILLTEQSHQLLNTILSRCQSIRFHLLPKTKLMEKLMDEGITSNLARLAVEITNDFTGAMALCQNDWFAKGRDLVLKLYEAIQAGQGVLFLHEHWLKHFKEREEQQTGLDLLLLVYKDILYTQAMQQERLVFASEKTMLDTQAMRLSGTKIANGLAYILQAKQRLSANVHPSLAHEQMVLALEE